MKTKNLFRFRKENGAITVWSALMMTVIIGFTALSIDIGLHHYMGAKLQNAVDSAATAVASSLGAADTSLEDVAYDYLAKNGYDRDDERFNGSLKVYIEQKGVGNEDTMYEDEYITTGYYKITAEVDDSTLFATIFDIDSLHLSKTAYVKCEANYVDMPRALKYTIFGGSSTGTAGTPTVDINGRTGDTLNSMVNGIQNLINNINSNFVQPLIGIFGGTPNYNTLVHINLSEVITDGDVHSNSNIAIGVQALNVSRVKDQDYEGEEQYNAAANAEVTVDNEQAYDDYGQVTYTAVTDILFDSSLKNSGGQATHIYVQNQQYLEQTQVALNILNTINFKDNVSNITNLQTEYDTACTNYFADSAHSNVTAAQQAAIRAQANNLNYGAKNSYSLINQGQIVYNVNQTTAENYLRKSDGSYYSVDEVQDKVTTAGIDQMFGADSSTLRYANQADTSGSINYGIKMTKDVYVCSNCGYSSAYSWNYSCPSCHQTNTLQKTQPSDQSATITIQGTQVNRDLANLTGASGASMTSATDAGAHFALVRTFQAQSEYITVPNMKPYFVRQVNTSIRSATKSKEAFTSESAELQATGEKTVKQAVSALTNEINTVIQNTSYEDNKYLYASDYTNLETTPIFKYYQSSENAAAVELTGTDRTVLNGYQLFSSSGILKDAQTHISEFYNAEFKQGNINESDYGYGAINTYYNDYIKDNTEGTSYQTNYGADAVAKKKQQILGSASFDDAYATKQTAIAGDTSKNLPSEKGVFLVKNDATYEPTASYNAAMNAYGKTATTTFRTYGFWGWTTNYSGSGDDWQWGLDLKFNTTATDCINSVNSLLNSRGWGWYPDNYQKYELTCNTDGSWKSGGDYIHVAGKGQNNEWKNGMDFYEKRGDWDWNKGLVLTKSTRLLVDGFANAKNTKSLVANQNSVLLVRYDTANANDGYGLKVDNDITMHQNSMIAVKSNVKTGNYSKGSGNVGMALESVIVIDGNFEVKGSVTMGNDCVIIVGGNMTVSGGGITFGERCRLVVRGTLTVNDSLTIPADAYVAVGGLTVNGSSHRIVNKGILTATGDVSVANGSDWFSLLIQDQGKVYIGGNVSLDQRLTLDGTSSSGSYCTLYVCGNVDASNNSSTSANDALWVMNDSRVYIGGYMGTTSSTNRYIWVSPWVDGNNKTWSGSQNAIVSIAGGFKNLDGLNNEQSNCTMYLKGNNSNPLTISSDGLSYLHNYHYIYCYSSLTVNKATSSLGDDPENSRSNANGKTIVQGNATFTGTVTASNNHLFYVSGTLTATGVKATGGSKVWGAGAISVTGTYSGGDAGCLTTTSNDADHKSEIFCGPSSSVTANMGLNINGYIYFPGASSTMTLKRLDIGQYGTFITQSSISIKGSSNSDQAYFYVRNGGFLYVGGLTTLNWCRMSNDGTAYLMGGYYRENLPSGTDPELILGRNSETFIASRYTDGIGTLTLANYFLGRGNLYIENNVNVTGSINSNIYNVGARWVTFVQEGGSTYISGYLQTAADNAFKVTSGGIISCQNNLVVGSVIYNDGKIVVVNGSLVVDANATWTTDAEMDSPTAKYKRTYLFVDQVSNELCLHMGRSINNVSSSSVIYVGGTGTARLDGYIENYGKIFTRGSFDIYGYDVVGNSLYFGRRYSRQRGDLNDTVLTPAGQNKNAFNNAPRLSIINAAGAELHAGRIDCSGVIHNRKDAVTSSQTDMLYGMALLNGGKMVAFGTVGYSSHKYYINHIEMFEKVVGMGDNRTGSYSFVNGYCYGDSNNSTEYNRNALFYSGSGIQLGDSEDAADNGISGTFQNWGTAYINGNFTVYSNKALAYNISALVCQAGSETFINGNVWSSSVIATMGDSSYGGSIFMCQGDWTSKRASKIGISEEFDNNDEFQRNFVYVGGNMYNNTMGISSTDSTNTNDSRDMDVYSNTAIYVGGSFYCNSKLYLKSNCTLIVEGKTELYDNQGNFLQKLISADRNNVLSTLVQNFLHSDNYKFYVAQCIDAYPNSTIISRGSMFVNDTVKIRDMTKTYVYGNFYTPSYVEIGKALDGADETEAKETANSTNAERQAYKFSRAAYMYVGGNFTSQRYTKIFASSGLRVKYNFSSWNYLTLRHDAEFYAGGYCWVYSSIDGGVFSTIRVGDYMRANTSTIKLRDGVDCYVGGDMTAMSYIELGKYDDSIQNANGSRMTTISTAVTEGGEDSYSENGNEDNPEQGQSEGNQGADAGDDSNAGEVGLDQKTIETAAELAADETDLAQGGRFLIDGVLVTYTGYIKEFAYSRVAVGKYVLAPKYITLRSNADMWVLPPSFGNDTYERIPYAAANDGTILGWIIDRIEELKSTVEYQFAPHNGSIYSLGELTLNKNASLFGTYDCKILGQCVLRQSSLVYLGHDFDLTAPSLNVSLDVFKGNESVTGFDTYGTASANGYTFPAVVYADNSINIFTTIDMKLTYLVCNRGDLNLYNVYSKGDNAERNAKQLPNALCSYQGNVNYNAMYGKFGALFYAPSGNVDLDGYYSEIWGSMVGNRVISNTYYLALHRFTNWRTMQLNVAESGTVYLIPQKEYDDATDNVDDIYQFNENHTGDNQTFVPGDRPFYY